MKDSWLLYDYLRRRWQLLLVFCILGALAGHLLDDGRDFSIKYRATATVAMDVPRWSFKDPPSELRRYPRPVMATLTSSTESSRQLAAANIESQMMRIAAFGPAWVTSQGIIIDEVPQGVWVWWKALVLGSVVGGLLAVGCIYVWEDGKEYRHRARLGV